jgi:hypothetical protein
MHLGSGQPFFIKLSLVSVQINTSDVINQNLRLDKS